MAYSAEVLADSVSPRGDRLTTLEVTFPRFILPEFNTHRVFSRNSASSRAIPTKKRFNGLLDDPVLPVEWGKNQPGMQASELLSPDNAIRAEKNWLLIRDFVMLGTVALVGGLEGIDDESVRNRLQKLVAMYPDVWEHFEPLKGESAHKQVANRWSETGQWHTVVVTATDWDNFYALRKHAAAQPEIRKTAELMSEAMESSVPKELHYGEWHLPFVTEQEKKANGYMLLAKMSVARCARVSYETHDTGKVDIDKDIQLHDTLKASGHMSPFEHVARPIEVSELAHTHSDYSGNFKGWHQYRKDIPNEDNYGRVE